MTWYVTGAFSQTPAKLDITHPALTKIAGGFHDAAAVRSGRRSRHRDHLSGAKTQRDQGDKGSRPTL
jgi:hypothetical protein